MTGKRDRWAEWDRAMANPTAEEIAAMAAIGSEPGAVGYNEAGQLVRLREDGSEEILEQADDAQG